jgi:hypothetical protein
MYAQSKNVIQSATCLLLVAASLFAVAGCMGPMHYQGWLSRPVIVTVTDADTSKAVSGATVKLKAPDDMQKFLANKEKYEKVTDLNGKAELIVWFPCGGKQTLWFHEGLFSLRGAGMLEVDAEGYKHFEREFVSLIGEHSRSVNNESPVKVNVKLSN